MTATSDRVVEALAGLHRFAESRPAPGPQNAPPAVTVALSRQAGSRGAEVARAAGARLGWPVYDAELLKRIAEEKGLPEKLVATLDERHFSWLEGAMRSFSPVAGATERAYIKGLLEVFAALGKAGHCVIVGRGGAHLLPAETTLRVRVVAPRESRIAAVQASMHFTPEQAARWVDHTDHERAVFVARAFRADVADLLGYDLVLNSARLGIDGCADLIAQAARAQDARVRQGAR
jgi:cytidylate kinase